MAALPLTPEDQGMASGPNMTERYFDHLSDEVWGVVIWYPLPQTTKYLELTVLVY